MTLDDIMDIRGGLEQGLAANINTLLATYTRLNAVEFQKDRPRVEIVVAVGNATGAKRAFMAEKIVRNVRWNFTVAFRVITMPDPENTLHAQLVARVRGWASSAAQATWEDTASYPCHYIAEALMDAGSPSFLKTEEGNEETTLSFAGQVGIRETAWAQAGL